MTTAEKLRRIAQDLRETLGDQTIYSVTVSDILRDWGGSGDSGVADATGNHLAQALDQKAKELEHQGLISHRNHAGTSIPGELSSPFGD